METLSGKQLNILTYLANNSDVLICTRPKGEPVETEVQKLIDLGLVTQLGEIPNPNPNPQLDRSLKGKDYTVIEVTEQGRLLFHECEFCECKFCPAGKTIQ